MPINVCHGIYKLLLPYYSQRKFIDYNQYHAYDDGYRALTQ